MLMDEEGVKPWFANLEQVLYGVFHRTNFYKQVHKAYRGLTVGNGVIYREEHPTKVVVYKELPLFECYWEKNIDGEVTSMYRELRLTPTQMIEKFGDSVSEDTRKKYEKGSTEKVKVIHVVRPRWQRDSMMKDAKNKKFESIYFEFEQTHILKESGYDTFCYFVAEWLEDPNSDYGEGPGHMCLYSMRSLNEGAKTTIRAFQKDTDPPLSIPFEGYVTPIKTDPNGYNYRTSGDPKDKIEPIQTGSNPFSGMEFMKWIKDEINRAFFVNLFQAITDTTKRMTIPEVEERIAENAPLLGPSIGGLLQEFIKPMVEDLVEIVIKRKMVPPAPEAIQGAELKIEFVSRLAKLQRMTEIQGIQSFVNMAAPAIQLKPEAADNLNIDKYIQIINDITGAPTELLNEPSVVKKLRQDRAEAMAREEQRQQALQAAEGARNASDADLKQAKAGAA